MVSSTYDEHVPRHRLGTWNWRLHLSMHFCLWMHMHGKMQYINIQGIRSTAITSNELQQLQKLVFFFHNPKSGSCQFQHTVYFFVKLQAFIFSFSSKRNILDWRNGSISEREHWLLFQRSWSWCPEPIQWLTTTDISSSRGSNALWWLLWAPGIRR